MLTGRLTKLVFTILVALAGIVVWGSAPRAAHAADLEDGDFVVGVRSPDPPLPYPYYLKGGQIVRVRGGVSTPFCTSSLTYYTNGFFHNPHDVVLDGQGRVVFLAALGPSDVGTGDGFGLWRCDHLGATPTMLGAFGGGSALGYPQPVGAQAVCHAQGLHMKRIKGLDLNNGTASSSELYVFAINKACGSGPFETIGYEPVSGQWTESLEDPVPTAMAGPLDGFHMDMINANGFTFSVANSGIRGVTEPIRLDFQIGEFTGGLALQGTVDVINGQPVQVLFDDLTVPNQVVCEVPDGVPLGTPYSHAVGGTKYAPSGLSDVAWRDGGLLLQPGSGFSQEPNITNLALFTPDPLDDLSSLAHEDFGCGIIKTLQFTPWHDFNSYWDSNGVAREVVRMVPDGRFGTQPGRIVGLGPGDVTIYAEGLESPVGIDVYPPFVPTTSGVAVFFKIESPVNVLITASDGRRIGADLATGAPINDYGSAGYDSQTGEPRIYGLRDPLAGNFTIQTKGTATGPYKITTYGANLATDVISQAPFTGNTAIGIESTHQFALDAAGSVTPIAPDSDGDGIVDSVDDCSSVPNASQLDADSDGYGNACDPDLDQNGVVNAADLARLKSVFFKQDPIADLNGDGVVNAVDLATLKGSFFKKPGPSGVSCAGNAGCGTP